MNVKTTLSEAEGEVPVCFHAVGWVFLSSVVAEESRGKKKSGRIENFIVKDYTRSDMKFLFSAFLVRLMSGIENRSYKLEN